MISRLNMKSVLLGIGIFIIKIRQSWDRAIFIMKIHILERRCLYIQTTPASYNIRLGIGLDIFSTAYNCFCQTFVSYLIYDNLHSNWMLPRFYKCVFVLLLLYFKALFIHKANIFHFTQGQFWTSSIVVACVSVSVYVPTTSLSVR